MGTSRLKSRSHASMSSTILQHKNDKQSKPHDNFYDITYKFTNIICSPFSEQLISLDVIVLDAA